MSFLRSLRNLQKNTKRGKIMKENKRGVTLIALIITIIVLLILAGVNISMLTRENGIISQANEANLKNNHGTVLEALRLKLSQYLSENEGTYVKDKLELLRDDNIIDENNIVNVLELVEQKFCILIRSKGKRNMMPIIFLLRILILTIFLCYRFWN